MKGQSPALKKIKYEKLLKLYNDVVDKKEKILAKNKELEDKQKIFEEMRSVQQQSNHAEDSEGKKKL